MRNFKKPRSSKLRKTFSCRGQPFLFAWGTVCYCALDPEFLPIASLATTLQRYFYSQTKANLQALMGRKKGFKKNFVTEFNSYLELK